MFLDSSLQQVSLPQPQLRPGLGIDSGSSQWHYRLCIAGYSCQRYKIKLHALQLRPGNFIHTDSGLCSGSFRKEGTTTSLDTRSLRCICRRMHNGCWDTGRQMGASCSHHICCSKRPDSPKAAVTHFSVRQHVIWEIPSYEMPSFASHWRESISHSSFLLWLSGKCPRGYPLYFPGQGFSSDI